MLLADYLRERYALERDIRQQTAGLYKGTIKSFSGWLGFPASFIDLSDDAINRWLVWLTASGISKTTVANHRRFMLTIWRHAFQAGATNIAPLRIRKIQVPRTLPQAWSQDQMCRLLEAADKLLGVDIPIGVRRASWFRALILVAWSTGLRLGDIQALKRDQIAPDGSMIVVQQKTLTPVLCRLHPDAMAAVMQVGHLPDGRIFGGRLSRRPLFRDFRWIANKAGLVGGTKIIRKSSATAVEAIQPGAAKDFLGHLTAGLAYRHYVDQSKTGQNRPQPPELPKTG